MGTIIEIVKPCEEAKGLTQWDLGRKIIIRPDAESIVDEVRFSNAISKKALVVEPTFDELGNIVSGIPNILLQSSLEIYVSVVMHFKDGKCVIHKETLEVAPEKKPSDYIYTEIEIKNYEELEQRIKALEEQGAGGNGKPGSDGFSPIANVVETTAGAVITITDKKGTTTATVKNGIDGKDGADGAKGEKGDKGDTGSKGADGTSISIKNISESTVDGGNNVVTFNDGQKMIVKNGHKGSDGKTAYQYAQDGGYVGTEEEFAEKLAQENPTKEKFEEEIGKLSKEISDLKESEHDIPMIINVTVTAEGQFVADKTFEEVFAVCKTVPCYVFADGLTLPLHNCSTDWCEFRYNKFHRGTYSIVTYTLCKVILNSDNSVEITMEEHELATGDDVYEINTRLYDLQYEVNNLKIPTVDDVLNELPTWQGGAY